MQVFLAIYSPHQLVADGDLPTNKNDSSTPKNYFFSNVSY